MAKRQVFWDTFQTDAAGSMKHGTSGSRMYREGTTVIHELRDFDSEDNKVYDYMRRFDTEAYRKAVEELRKTGRSELNGSGCTLSMRVDGEYIKLSFSSVPSLSDSKVSANTEAVCKLEDLILKE